MDNEWKQDIYHNSQGFPEESITETKRSVLNFQIYINLPMETELWRLYHGDLYKLLNFSKIYSFIRADKISNINIAEKSTKISLTTPSDFQSPSNHQELQSSTEFDGCRMSACFIKILKNLQ